MLSCWSEDRKIEETLIYYNDPLSTCQLSYSLGPTDSFSRDLPKSRRSTIWGRRQLALQIMTLEISTPTLRMPQRLKNVRVEVPRVTRPNLIISDVRRGVTQDPGNSRRGSGQKIPFLSGYVVSGLGQATSAIALVTP